MERAATGPTDGETWSNDGPMTFNRVDSSSSYEVSSETEIAQKETLSPNEYFQSSRRRQIQSTSREVSTSTDRSRKRKAEKLATRDWEAKRFKGFYNNDYRQILNEQIREIISPTVPENYDRLPQSQAGVTIWTSLEKDSFFTALTRLGKSNVRAIALRIGSKSEFEVQDYIHLLHQGMLEKNLNEPRRQLLGLTDTPTAIQVSQECCEQLEQTADVLASRQERYEENEEQKRWGKFWLLTSGTSDLVEERLSDEEDNSPELKKLLPAVDLLIIRNWLELSDRVFMNPAAPREDENWRFLAEPGEEPGIRATAFADFYRLTVSLTKRLVSASIFCAMSRLRATDSTSFSVSDFIKSADVQTAAKTIGLKLNSQNFWTGCARRCNLEVRKQTSTAVADQSPMDYDEVENFMGSKTTRQKRHKSEDDYYAASPSNITSPLSSAESLLSYKSEIDEEVESENDSVDDTSRDLASEYMQELGLIHGGPIDPSDSEFENPRIRGDRAQSKLRHKADLIRAQDEYAEAFDLQASLVEEQKLWEILKKDPPFTVKPEDILLPKRPVQDRKEEDELGNWRENLQFRSQWESFDRPVPAAAFFRSATRQSKQREESAGESILDSESEVGDGKSVGTEPVEQDDLSTDEKDQDGSDRSLSGDS